MIEKVVIAGCRDYNNYIEAKKFIIFVLVNCEKQMKLLLFREEPREPMP